MQEALFLLRSGPLRAGNGRQRIHVHHTPGPRHRRCERGRPPRTVTHAERSRLRFATLSSTTHNLTAGPGSLWFHTRAPPSRTHTLESRLRLIQWVPETKRASQLPQTRNLTSLSLIQGSEAKLAVRIYVRLRTMRAFSGRQLGHQSDPAESPSGEIEWPVQGRS